MDQGRDALDAFVEGEMGAHSIPGVSLAMIREGRVAAARGYGHVAAGERAVDSKTLFQAASISKTFVALGALILVEQGRLALDEDVNSRLKDWKVPENEFTRMEKVTVRRILSHTAGLTVHGFPGYARGRALPELTDILDGVGCANTAPIRVAAIPGSEWKYSGGGYTVLQKLMIDVTGESFPDLMRELVLEPLNMENSTFEQPLPAAREGCAACGHVRQIGRFRGNWNVYPEMAAAGLWSTPSDLVRFVIAMQEAKAGRTGGVLSPAIAGWMTTPVMKAKGLGLALGGVKNQFFGHDGRNYGFDSRLLGSDTNGVAVMINANDDSGVVKRIGKAAWNRGG